jgi:hypothetical membrane protein
MALSDASKAGFAIFFGSVQFGILLIVAESVYPGYSVSLNYVSDLGATCPSSGSCVIDQPASIVFSSSIILLGVSILLGAYFLQKEFHWTPASALIGLAGVGALGVGLFPETTGIVHSLFSLMVFLFSGLSAIVAARFQKKPLFYLSIILGFATLIALLLYVDGDYLGLGVGGMERMVVYPVLLWGIGFGGHLMAFDDTTKS